ncbi:hypothetical protein [Risungbinella massiliensis]|uniref:hypothetical protein n=1 Tax=Risungbinella massiliensis TaxID=1329796 RepID=UPI0005CC8CDA|nr:hypothetical protein [Risungbinella massiliensis]
MSIESVKKRFVGSVVENLISVPLELYFENDIYLELWDTHENQSREIRAKIYFKPRNQPYKVQLYFIPTVQLLNGEFSAKEQILIDTIHKLRRIEVPEIYYEMFYEIIQQDLYYNFGVPLFFRIDPFGRLQMGIRVTDNTGLIIIVENIQQEDKLRISPCYFHNFELHPIREHRNQTYKDIVRHINRLKAL